jgi:tetratricopeptide (TPR) repeat protein
MHKPFCFGLTVYCAALAAASACLQSKIHLPQQLPSGIFTRIAPAALTMELSLPGGAKTVSLHAPAADPRGQIAAIIKHFEQEPGKAHSFEERNDYAAALIYAGRHLEAIAVLTDIERDFPGKYSTASNLGTAYELGGNLERALQWIREGIKRNPESHGGTEWLHVAILETKMKLKGDARWLVTHSVLDGHESRSQADKEKALEYQLNERLNFIHGNDPVMHDLFVQAARLTGNEAKREYYLSQLPRFAASGKGGRPQLHIPASR